MKKGFKVDIQLKCGMYGDFKNVLSNAKNKTVFHGDIWKVH